MPTPNKPTDEELKAKEEEAVKAADELEGRQSIPQDETEESEEVEENENPPVDDTSEEEGTQEKEPEQEEKVEEPDEEQAEPSKEMYKRKFSASSRQNQKIEAKNRVINKALAEAEDVAEPTEEELIDLYPDYDLASDIEKNLIKETEISKRWRKTIAEAKEQATKIEKWTESVDEFVADPKTLIDNPELEGKTEEFREFAHQETNNNVPFYLLVGAFLHEQTKNGVKNKGGMFERGSGGTNEKPKMKTGTISLEEGRKLRETNYPKWKELLNAGKIVSDL